MAERYIDFLQTYRYDYLSGFIGESINHRTHKSNTCRSLLHRKQQPEDTFKDFYIPVSTSLFNRDG